MSLARRRHRSVKRRKGFRGPTEYYSDMTGGEIAVYTAFWLAGFGVCWWMIDQNKLGGSTTVMAFAGASALFGI